MSYYFAIVGTQDNPLFEHEFGTSKLGGDGQSRFSEHVRHLNQIILHSSLDIAEEVQWSHGQMYLKCIDKFFNNYISCFVTASGPKFLLLHQPTPTTISSSSASTTTITTATTTTTTTSTSSTTPSSSSTNNPSSSSSSTAVGTNPTSPATEEAIRLFFSEVYENWVKAVMNPFYRHNMEVRSPVFRARVAAAGRKYL